MVGAVASNDTDIANVDGRADSLVNALNAEITRATGREDSLVGAVASNDTDIANVDGRADSLVTALNAEISATNTDITNLGNRADSLVTAVAGNDTDIATLDTRADSLVTAVASNDTDITNLDNRADSLVNALNAEVTRATTREDSIIGELYWNQAVAGTVTLDAGVDSVKMDGVDVNVENLDVDSTALFNSGRQSGIVLEVLDEDLGSALIVNATTGVFIDDLTLNDSFSLTGSMSATTYTTTSGDPTNDNHLARKAYVDAQIAAEVGAVDCYDYAATSSDIANSVAGNLTYYLNGALLFYDDITAGDQSNSNTGYEITVYGDGFAAGQTASLYIRGQETDLVTNNNWAAAIDGATATFDLTYSELVAAAGGQTDGVVRAHLVVDGKNSGLTLKFHLDSTSSAATSTSFN